MKFLITILDRFKLYFFIFQLSACGDLFYQTYRPGAPGDDRTCCAGPGSSDTKLYPEVQNICKEWLGQLQDLNDMSADERSENIPHRKIDVTDMFTGTSTQKNLVLKC
jgi:hypothetical protein